ncbi:hypothetical protein H4219_000375 [Mycoemilia scoparia]|uniref:High-affinity methionine permease n=1 Tax=Mycoemilia scoparia TaxID=417184 RepID=A0A9W8DRS3_9FUNG|nr:hypothetical protein H4219_000375 [Mycoemilia scoparia]
MFSLNSPTSSTASPKSAPFFKGVFFKSRKSRGLHISSETNSIATVFEYPESSKNEGGGIYSNAGDFGHNTAGSGAVDNNLDGSMNGGGGGDGSGDSDHSHHTNGEPHRHIGFLSSIGMLFSLIIGSGIFSTPATVLALCGTPAAALIMWVVGALITYSGALAFIEMGLMYPKNGGMMRYLGYSFPRPRALISFVFAYTVCLLIRPATVAAGATAFSDLFLYAVSGGEDMPTKNPYIYKHRDWIGRGIGAAAMTLVVLLNAVSIKWSLRVVNVLAVVKVLVLLVICIVGILALAKVIRVEPNDNWSRGFRGTSNQAYNYVSAMNKIFWAYEGWGNLSYAGGELKNPRRNLPIAMGTGLTIIAILYILANVAFFTVVPIDEALSTGTMIGAVFTTKILGKVAGEVILPIIMAISAVGVNIGEIYSGARLLHCAADVGFVPFGQRIAQIHPVFKTPVYSLGIIWLLSLVYLMAPPPGLAFDFLVDLVSYPMWYFYALAILGCLILRKKFPAHPRRTFKSPAFISILFFLSCLFLAFAVFVPPRGSTLVSSSVKTIDTSSEMEGSHSYLIGPLVAIAFMLAMGIPWALRMVWYAKKHDRNYDAWVAKEENAIATEGLGVASESRFSIRDIEDTYGSTPWKVIQQDFHIQ